MSSSLKPIKWYKTLNSAKERRQNGAFLLEGVRAISHVANFNPDMIEEILSTGTLPPEYSRFQSRLITENQLRSISSAKNPQGMIAVVKLPEGTYENTLPEEIGGKLLLLEDIQDPGNLGTLVRTAAAFGYSGVIMTENCADPFSPKSIQSSAGSALSIWLRRTGCYVEMVELLKERGYPLIAMDLEGDKQPSALKTAKHVLALGNEGAGLTAKILKLADYRVKLPLEAGGAESLNVAACGAICMYLSSNQS